ncbi:PREDICTED: tripartite motif-containing protein 2-like [Branchiostoma belcheri]|uniref:RING-type E3 ubiquitin transferase n=1 Tax=Branchiostoma belcheri TaxID=7741 RepID=A0A6P5AUY7_BRABE|nr:PREDICTED: tripartite motif-containing protein 2-like [Branchiostoma belcheri]
MASKMASDELDEEFLTCQVCMLHFRDPKILPCLHTFCKVCLEEWATKQQPLECSICRIPVSLLEQGVDGLKTNFYVNNLLDFVAAKKGAEPGVPCQVCEGNVEGSKSWCADCGVLLCESCTAMHRKIPGTRDHELVPQDVMTAKDGADRFQRKRHCDKHKNQELVFYCESCNALVCTACTVIDHRPGKDHNPVEITTIAQKKKEKLQELLQDMDPRLKEVQASIDEVDKNMSKLIPSKEEATTQAKAYFRQLADLLEKREEEILRQIDEQCRADGKALQAKKEAIEFELAGLTSAQTFCQQAVEHGSDVHVLEVGNQVQTRVESLLAKELDLESNWNEFQFIESTSVADFAEKVKNLGDLGSVIDVTKCQVVVKPAVEGFQCIAVLTTLNQIGRPSVTESIAAKANMKDPSGASLQTQLQMTSGAVWEISYVPKVTGNHRLEVKVNSKEVAGSPFDIEVQSRHTPVLTMGQQGSGVGELDMPAGVVVDQDGNIAVVEQRNKRVQIFDLNTGHSLRTFPVEGKLPYDIDVDSYGRFLVTSFGNNYRVRCYSKEGKLLNTFSPGCMKQPLGITVLKDGRMVVADISEQSCFLLQYDGSLIREIGKGKLQKPRFTAVDESRGMIFVTDYTFNKVFVFDLEGEFKFSFGEKGEGEGQFRSPMGITLDRAGNIIVVNYESGRVQVFRPDGTFIRTVMTVKGKCPHGITLTPDGYIAVACSKGQCIEMYRYN